MKITDHAAHHHALYFRPLLSSSLLGPHSLLGIAFPNTADLN